MEVILDPARKSPKTGPFKWIKEVQVVDNYTFRLITQKPYPLVLERLIYLFPYDPKYVKEKGFDYLAEHPVGTGPYKFVKWDRGSSLEITANENYWMNGVPKIKNIIFRIIPEVSTRLAELMSGGVDLVANLDPDKIVQLRENKNLKTVTGPTYRITFWQFDSSGKAGKTPLTDIRVRRAICHAIDREAIIKTFLMGAGEIANSPVTRFHFGYDPTVKGYDYDPEKAKALLKEAGYENGFTIDLWYYYDIQYLVDQAAMGYLNDVGIKLNLRDYRGNIGQLMKIRNSGKCTGIGNFAWGSLFVFDADALLPAWFLSREGKCYNPDPDLDKWLMEARFSLDEKKRKELYSKAQHKIIEQAYWMPFHLVFPIHGARSNLDVAVSPDEMLRLQYADWK
jgi:peptide/nickel transport system substrate-binding protein